MTIDRYKFSELTKKIIENKKLEEFMPCQTKAFESGLLENKNILICSPTGSGKTLVAEVAIIEQLMKNKYTNKAVYIVPLRALASEKYHNFTKEYGQYFTISALTGDAEDDEQDLRIIAKSDIIIMTSEKLDSILRHNHDWIKDVKLVIVDEVHLLNDIKRGPVLEVVLTLLRELNKDMQLIALSATIGNSVELAKWLDAKLVYDEFRPVKLKKGVIFNNEIEFRE